MLFAILNWKWINSLRRYRSGWLQTWPSPRPVWESFVREVRRSVSSPRPTASSTPPSTGSSPSRRPKRPSSRWIVEKLKLFWIWVRLSKVRLIYFYHVSFLLCSFVFQFCLRKTIQSIGKGFGFTFWKWLINTGRSKKKKNLNYNLKVNIQTNEIREIKLNWCLTVTQNTF